MTLLSILSSAPRFAIFAPLVLLLGVVASHVRPLASAKAPSVVAEPGSRPRQPLTRAEAVSDLQDWRRRVVAVHPEPYAHVTHEALDAAVAATIVGLPVEISVEEFFVRVAEVAALIGDSHTSIVAPSSRAALRMPIVVEDGSLCFERRAGPVPAGACIEFVGSLAASEVLRRSRRMVSAETLAGADRLVPNRIPLLLASLGYRDTVPLTVRLPNGERQTATLTAEPKGPAAAEALTVEKLEGGIFLLTLRTMVIRRPGEYSAAFAGIFAAIKRHFVRGVVIDLRDNDGGDTRVGELLLSYITERSHRLVARKRWKVSALMQAQVREMGVGFEAYLDAPVGGMLITDVEVFEPIERTDRYRGPVVFLTGPKTLSAAMMTADAVSEYKLALVVGESTSSPPNYFGETYIYQLPHSGLSATISTAAFVRASGEPSDASMVDPHVWAATRLLDRLSGGDHGLRTAIQLIERWNNPSGGGVALASRVSREGV